MARRRRGRGAGLLLVGMALAAAVASGGVWAWGWSMRPAEPGSAEPVALTVPKGATAGEIAKLLDDAGLIRNRAAWVLAASRFGYSERFQAGDYALSRGMSAVEIMEALTHGTRTTVRVTIPEGHTLRQIGHELERQTGLFSAEDFVAAARDRSRWPDAGFPLPTTSLEGYLFPDTYAVERDATPERVIAQMLERFREVYEQRLGALAASGLSLHEVVTLASIIEKEIRVPDERAIAAQVFLLRLRKGIRLESCATVQYVLPQPKAMLTEADLRIRSPYNTYLHAGLPPGPICSPGEACIDAVLHPANTDYLYFVLADEEGRHHFSRTYREHLAAKR